MYDRLYQFLVGMATWPRVLLLVALFLLIAGVFELRRKELGPENKSLDVRYTGYSPAEARNFFEAIGPDGRRLYANTQLTLDLAFPLVYGALFAALLILLYGQQGAKYFVPVPALTVLLDVAENVTASIMALSFKGQESSLAGTASFFTQAKSLLFVASLLLIAAGVVVAAGVALRR